MQEGRPEDLALPANLQGSDAMSLVDKQDHAVTYKNSLFNAGLSNLNLGAIFDGFPKDLIELKPFSNKFCRPCILKWWMKVDFLPMTYEAVNDPKIRMELGEGRAQEEEGEHLKLLEEAFLSGAADLQGMGFNGIDVCGVQLPRTEKRNVTMDKETKIKLLLRETSQAWDHNGECRCCMGSTHEKVAGGEGGEGKEGRGGV